jgi:tol-pal system protein YbgF
MKRKSLFILIATLFIVYGCASQQDLDALKFEISNLQSRLATEEQKVGDLTKVSPQKEKEQSSLLKQQTEIQVQLAEVSAKLLGIQKKLDTLPEKDRRLDQSLKQQADIQEQCTELHTQLLSTQGKLDELESLYRNGQDDYLKQQSEFSSQLSDMQTKIEELDSLYNKLSTSAQDDKLNLMSEEINKIKDHLDIGKEKTTSLYERGLERFNNRKYEDAIKSFSEFLKNNPQESLTDNAHFWIGESLFGLGKYEDAILEYDVVLKNFKDSEKIPDCLLKQGKSFINLKDEQTGKLLLERVIKEFPGSEAAIKAKAILK